MEFVRKRTTDCRNTVRSVLTRRFLLEARLLTHSLTLQDTLFMFSDFCVVRQ